MLFRNLNISTLKCSFFENVKRIDYFSCPIISIIHSRIRIWWESQNTNSHAHLLHHQNMKKHVEFHRREAAGKPSTWFPLGGHVQKELYCSRILQFFSNSCRYRLSILRSYSAWELKEFHKDLNFHLFSKFKIVTSQISTLIKFVADRFFYLPYHLANSLALLEASIYEKDRFQKLKLAFTSVTASP
jgi:hypothetical protein